MAVIWILVLQSLLRLLDPIWSLKSEFACYLSTDQLLNVAVFIMFQWVMYKNFVMPKKICKLWENNCNVRQTEIDLTYNTHNGGISLHAFVCFCLSMSAPNLIQSGFTRELYPYQHPNVSLSSSSLSSLPSDKTLSGLRPISQWRKG